MSKKEKKKTEKTKDKPIQQHHYLNKLGVSSDEYCLFNAAIPKDDNRKKTFAKQRLKYGFDERETWSMDYTLATWLYEHFKLYRDIGGAVCDLEWHQIQIPVLKKTKKGNLKTTTKEVSQLKAIDLVCEYLEIYIKNQSKYGEDEERAYDYLKAALRIIAEIIPFMWW